MRDWVLLRQIVATDTQIDRLVYGLYLPALRACQFYGHRQAARQAGGLTEDPMRIVEENG